MNQIEHRLYQENIINNINNINNNINRRINIINIDDIIQNIDFYDIDDGYRVTYIMGGRKRFETFRDCIEHNEGLETYDNIKKLDCSNNRITSLVYVLPKNLEVLNCSNNKLTQLPWCLPPTLIELNCSRNKLVSLPSIEHFPPKLQVLKCNGNRLKSIPWYIPHTLTSLHCCGNKITKFHKSFNDDNFKNLLHLYCSGNQLVNLPNKLPHSLISLRCGGNKLRRLPGNLPPNLKELICHNNNLTHLPDNLPINLRTLLINNNRLRSLPISLIRLRRVRTFTYDDRNDIILHIPPQVRRWINRIRGIERIAVYVSQSVHNHSIQVSVRESIERLTSQPFDIDEDQIINDILLDNILTRQCKESLIEYCNNGEIHSTLHLTFKELLGYVWKTIEQNESKDEIKNVLNIEMRDAKCMCFTGRISRLINCLNGFSDLVRIEISDSEQIGNIIIVIQRRLTAEDNYSVEEHRKIVKKELLERGFSNDIIEEWIQHIE